MSKRKQLLLAVACLVASYLAGNGIYSFLSDVNGFDTQRGSNYPAPSYVALESPLRSAPPGPAGSLGPMLKFQLKDEFGSERTFEEIHSGRPALLYFFSGGCPHCFNMMQNIGPTLSLARSRGFRVVGVQYYGTPEQGQQFRRQYNLPSPVLADTRAEICGRLGVGEFTIMLVGSDNNLYYRSLMNGSNWPNSEAFAQTINLGGAPSPIAEPEKEPQKTLVQISRPKSSVPSLLVSSPFINRFYQPIFIGLIVLILIGTAAGLSRARGSWLPVLAAGELLLMGVIFDVWLYWPANLFLVLAAVLLTIERKWILGPAASASFLIIGFLLRPVFDEALLSRTEQLQQMAFIWRFIPQAILSVVMFRLAFTAQKQVYHKVVLTGAGEINTAPAHEGAIAIRGVSRPERCDVCHQADQFDQQTGYCSRCQRKTN